MTRKIRQPIVTVCGHVDHGKTSILDALRQTSIQKYEAGGITQKISFTLYPAEQMKTACPLIEKSGVRVNIPGFLFIDTPGHAAFTNLRKRGGSLADLAVLVIDINEGVKPQTAETINILKINKVPFVIALNKIDNITGWKKDFPEYSVIKEIIEEQKPHVQQIFNERYMTIIAALNSYGFEADLFYNIEDFTKKIGLIPCSAIYNQGLQELIMVLCGLSQKYLTDKLELHKEPKGIVLEIKKEKAMNYIEAILYDGTLSLRDEIAVSDINGEAIITKIRVLEEIKPLSTKFEKRDFVTASTGIRMQLAEKVEILPGMPFMKFTDNKEAIEKIFKKEISGNIKTRKQGIVVKADSLGSLEALLTILEQNNIYAVKAGIGNINKTDIISGKTNLEINELDAVIVGFNVSIDDETREMAEKSNVKVIIDEVIYKLVEELIEFRKQKKQEIEKRRLMALSPICRVKILREFVFRNSNPAIFGVRVEAGKLVPGMKVVNEKNQEIGRIKNIQHENNSIKEAREGMEVAISIPGLNFERTLKDTDFLYSDISDKQLKKLKENKDLLTEKEKHLIQELSSLKESVI